MNEDNKNRQEADDLTTLAVFDNGFQANLLRAKLTDCGIDAYVFDENTITLNPLYSNLLGGIKVKVRITDLQEAREVYSEINNTPITDENDEIIYCPKCNSDKISPGLKSVKSTKSILAYLAAIFTGTYPLHTDTIYYCRKCNHGFK
jgi:hypothetical protein